MRSPVDPVQGTWTVLSDAVPISKHLPTTQSMSRQSTPVVEPFSSS